MGFDVSAHPVDVPLIQARLLPYLRGEGSIDDLVADGVRLTKVRFRANAWGLGLLAATTPADGGKSKTRKGKRPPDDAPATPPAAGFDADLHVWGRPFFVTAPPESVGPAIDRYLAAAPEEVDAIAREQLDLLDPALKDRVVPDADGFLPEDSVIAAGLRQELDLLRAAYPNLANGKAVTTPDGESTDPEDVFLFNMPLAVATFAAQFTPGWMARGYVWPTAFVTEAGLDADGLIESAGSLFEPLLHVIGGWQEAFEPTITQNYTVGGYVRPANVPAFRAWWAAHRDALVGPFAADGDGELGAAAYHKILEAVRDAERRGMGFLEAAEVYSGFMGVMN